MRTGLERFVTWPRRFGRSAAAPGRRDRGAVVVEYAALVALIAAVSMPTLDYLQDGMADGMERSVNCGTGFSSQCVNGAYNDGIALSLRISSPSGGGGAGGGGGGPVPAPPPASSVATLGTFTTEVYSPPFWEDVASAWRLTSIPITLKQDGQNVVGATVEFTLTAVGKDPLVVSCVTDSAGTCAAADTEDYYFIHWINPDLLVEAAEAGLAVDPTITVAVTSITGGTPIYAGPMPSTVVNQP